MKKRVLSIMTAFVLLFSITVSAQEGFSSGLLERLRSNTVQPVPDQDDIVLIVEVEGEPVCSANLQSFGGEAVEQQNRNMKTQAFVQREIQNVVEVPAEVEQVYTSVLNGFSIKVDSAAEIEKIVAIPGVKSVSVSGTFRLPELDPSETEPDYEARLVTSGGLIGADEMARNGYSGEGQVVAVIDSELDIDHDFFNQTPNGQKYTKEDMAQLLMQEDMHFNLQGAEDEVYKSDKIPFAYDYVRDSPDVYDTQNIHGTHVSGIAVGKDGYMPDGRQPFSGVAPEAQLVFMKVFNGKLASEAIIIEAIDDAAKLGVSAINLSLGADYFASGNNPAFSKAVENARAKGIFIACASGNATLGYKNGAVKTENIEYSASGTPASYGSATSVAASANSAIMLHHMAVNNRVEMPFVEGSGETTFASAFSKRMAYPYVYAGYGTKEDFAALEAKYGVLSDFSDLIVLVKQGGPAGMEDMMSSDKFANAEAAGAAGCIFWLTEPLNYAVTVSPSTIPTCIIQNEMGLWMSETENGVLQARQYPVSVPLEKEDQLYQYTSWGTDGTLELKPEIMAPGENIYSSYPSETHDKYMSLSGTSMATPHITGAAALLNQWYDDPDNNLAPKGADVNRADYFEKLMMSTSTILKQETGVPYSPRRQSAGLLNLENAVKSPVILVGDDGKTKLSLQDGLENSFILQFQAVNTSADTTATYDKIQTYVMTDGYVERDGETYVEGTVLLKDTANNVNISIQPGQKESIANGVVLDQTKLEETKAHFPNGFYIDGYIELCNSNNSVPPVHIPFMGFYGDWLSAPLFDGALYDGEYEAQGTRLRAEVAENRWQDLGFNVLTEEFTDQSHIAFSPNGDGIFDRLAVGGCLLRDAGQVTWELKDASGKVVATAQGENVSKFNLSTLLFDLPESLPDGEYTVTGSGYHISDKEKTHPYSFDEAIPVTVDTRPPEITAAQITTENGRTYAAITASDNNCVQAVALSAKDQPDQDGWAQVVDKESGTVKFDVTGCDPEDLTIEAVDYAMNQIAVPLATDAAMSVQNISLKGFTVVFDKAVSLSGGDFSLQKDGGDVRLPSVEKLSDTTYRIEASLNYATRYTLSVATPIVRCAPITFTTAARPSGDGKEGGIVVYTPSGTGDQPGGTTPAFQDVAPSSWYYTAVTEMARRGIVNGMGDGTFAPEETVKRADFLMMLMKAYQIAPAASGSDNFADGNGSYYSAYLAKAKAKGYVAGTGDNQFRPEEPITRQDMLVMLYRILAAEGKLPPAAGEPPAFTDSGDIAPYAREAVQALSAAGVVNGADGRFNPLGLTLRSEAAQVLYRLIN